MKRFVILTLALSFTTYTLSIYLESPALSLTLGKLSEYYIDGSIIISKASIKLYDPYKGTCFLPGVPIVLVDSGARYERDSFMCNVKGYATASLVRYLESNNLCMNSGTISLEEIRSIVKNVITYRGEYQLPSSDSVFKYCVTTTDILKRAGFDINSPTRDTIIVLQPLSWETDLLGQGTMDLSALCGVSTQKIGRDIIKLYIGSAIGSNIYVVSIGTYALILKDYEPRPLTKLQTPQLLLRNYISTGKSVILDYDFSYLGTQIAMLTITKSLEDALTRGLRKDLSSSPFNPIYLIEVSVPAFEDNMKTYCNKLKDIIHAPAVIAPLSSEIGQVSFSSYVWPAQCSKFVSEADLRHGPLFIGVKGYKIYYTNSTMGIRIVKGTINTGHPASTPWFSGPSTSIVTSVSYTTEINNNKVTISIVGDGVPTAYVEGSIITIEGNYPELGIPLSVSRDRDGIIISIRGTGRGGNVAAAYVLPAISLLSSYNKDTKNGETLLSLLNTLDEGIVNGGSLDIATVWFRVVKILGLYPCSSFPCKDCSHIMRTTTTASEGETIAKIKFSSNPLLLLALRYLTRCLARRTKRNGSKSQKTHYVTYNHRDY